MNFSYCYIDYSKQNESSLNIDKSGNYKEIKISSKFADIYFSAPMDKSSISLAENSNFVLLLDGEIEREDFFAQMLLELIEKRGIKEALDRVDGVFSTLLYDKSKQEFYLSRDHFGLNSLYYYQTEDIVLFSNTLKAFKNCSLFKKEINFDTLGQYLQHSYILQPSTMFVDCYKVKPAYFMKFELSTKEIQEYKYWDIVDFYNLPKVVLSEEEIIQKSEQLLKSAIKAKVGNSKKVGSFLSGGYDSSAIVSILSEDKSINLETFTVGFDDTELDEAPFAKQIAQHLDVKYNEYYFNYDYLESLIVNFADVYDEPLADMAALPTMLVCQNATEKVDVLFAGEGGDEIFASSGFIQRINEIIALPYPIRLLISYATKPFSKRTRYEKLSNMMKQKDIEKIWKYKNVTLSFSIVKKLIISPISEQEMDFKDLKFNEESHILDKFFPLVLKSYVSDDLLTKISFATKAYHVTPKAPYLDKNFVEFLATVDLNLKQKDGKYKYILSKILEKYIPNSLLERPKKGFSVPVGEMLKNELKPLLDRYINEDRLAKEGVFKPHEVMHLKKLFLNSNSYYDEQNIWNILIFQVWYEHWFYEK